MGEDNTQKCCFCIPIDLAAKIMMVFGALGVIGNVLNILNVLQYLSTGIGGIVLMIIIALGQAAAAFCYFKFTMVYYAHFKKGEEHDDSDRQSLVDAFKWYAYAVVAMNGATAIAWIIYGIIWGKGELGIGYGISVLITMIISTLITFAFLYWWRLSFMQHVNNNNGGGEVKANPMAHAKEMVDQAKTDAAEGKEAAAAAAAPADAPAQN